ncbi:hypothetical protein PAXRUDRAFT_162109 [Paxillus rubicundulus Ve08.2h10]|uniref:Uncharacterized protein n=1 Tax=Paxillus rubicundulus Ve08.2h10 TaxID=930991 RepID=A0A0D0D661_9AGAM|nr:hypothetical protein PAXRUDRAFT_162109 [Paxillus rubicundulus Ve08.2h10]
MPNGHYTVTYNYISFILPLQSEVSPFYLITRGKLISVCLSHRQWASPLVIGVSSASFSKVSSVVHRYQLMEDVIDNGLAYTL